MGLPDGAGVGRGGRFSWFGGRFLLFPLLDALIDRGLFPNELNPEIATRRRYDLAPAAASGRRPAPASGFAPGSGISSSETFEA